MTRDELKDKFVTGYKITQADYTDLADSIYFKSDPVSGEIYVDAGILIKPTFTDNANGSITLGSGTYILYSSTTAYPPKKYIISGNTFTLVDQAVNYITANYNSGTPILESSTSRTNINQLDVIPIYTIFRNGTNLVYFDWDHQAIGLANKLSDRLVRTRRYEIEPGGLILGEDIGRIVTITDGAIWTGGNRLYIESYRSDINNFLFFYHSNGLWLSSTGLTSYNNTQYDDGNNLQTLSNGRYAVNWIVKRIGSPIDHACLVLGNGNYTLAQALESKVPVLPTKLTSLGIIIGRIIVLKDATIAYQIDSAFENQFGNTSVNDHLNLSNLQGGQDGEYYHLTLQQQQDFVNKKFGTTNDYTQFESDGTMVAHGNATVFDDLLGSALQLQRTGLGVSLSSSENLLQFTTSSNLSDYGYDNYQISHAWKIGSVIYPHIHWEQAQNQTPNWLLQYRWQINGQEKVTSWTSVPCNTNAFTYTSGTLNQISYVNGGITPPVNANLSDIIEFRILRDNTNTSTVFAGADAYTATASLTSMDIHIEMDTLGSKQEYIK